MDNLLALSSIFALGDYVGLSFPLYERIYLGALLLSICLSLGALWRGLVKAFAMAVGVSIFFAGLVVGARANSPLPTDYFTQPRILVGEIVAESVVKGNYGSTSFLVEDKATGKYVRLKVKQGESKRKLQEYGQLQVPCYLKPYHTLVNPGLLDGQLQAKVQGLVATATVRSQDLVFTGDKKDLSYYAYRLRQRLEESLKNQVSASNYPLLRSMALGGSTQLEGDALEIFNKAGLVHLLAVSGTHVAILAVGLVWLLEQLGFTRAKAALGGAMGLFFYGALCSFKPSVFRAMVMGWGYLGGRSKDLRGDKGAMLGGAFLLSLLYKPWWILAPGLQLSFLATLGLLYGAKPLSQILLRVLPYKVAAALSVPLAAQLPLVPLLLYYFNRLNALSFISNALLLPLFSFLLLLLMGAFALVALYLPGAGGCFFLAQELFNLALRVMLMVGELPGSNIVVKAWPLGLALGYYLVLFSAYKFFTAGLNLSKGGRYLLFLGISLCLGGSCWSLTSRPSSRVYFLDVGQGDCAVILSAQRVCAVIDTGGLEGNFDPGERILVPFLRSLGVDKVDLLLLSHGHHDHAGGAAALVKNFPVGEVLLPKEQRGKDMEKMLALLPSTTPLLLQQAGHIWQKKDFSLETLYIPESNEDGDDNENCGIFRLVLNKKTVLFTGDATFQVEQGALNCQDLQAQILKVGHHGSGQASGGEFLDRVGPQLAVISCGYNNRFGHPHPRVLTSLHKRRIDWLRTDEKHAVQAELAPCGIKIYTTKRQTYGFLEPIASWSSRTKSYN